QFLIQQYNQVYRTTGEPSMPYGDSSHLGTEATSQNQNCNPISSHANEQVEANDSDFVSWFLVNVPDENMAAGDKLDNSSFDPLKKL
ncbi:hypothetical protein PanWU01x14_090000, partial [Parasponia andersonii]